MHKLIPLLLLLASAEWAQTQDNRNYSQTFPIRVSQQTPGTCQMWEFFIASTDGHVYECWSPNTWGNLITLNFPRGTTASLPATCNVGDPFIATDATSTEQLYICTSADTWTQQTASGGGGAVSSCSATGASWLTCAITTGNLNLTPTTGLTSHQVIATCGSATSFGPCSLTSAELPLSSMGTVTGPGNDTFSIEIGAGSLSGNTIVSNAPAAAASVSGSPLWVRGTITVFPSVVSGALTVCATTSGALSGTCKVAILNSATITAGQNNVIELVYQSGASTSSIAFSAAKITLEKP